MAEHLMLEQAMIDALFDQYKPDRATAFKARYFSAKSKLFDEILPWIRKNEPDLTDHSERHIENVLDNIYKLLQKEIQNIKNHSQTYLPTNQNALTGLDLYFLCQTALFHDVGNFYGRNEHNQKIADVLNKQFSDIFSGEHKRERKLIAEAGRSHTGKNLSGQNDTLFDLYGKSEHIQGDHIHYCSAAAIVRFADELAEGPQRTSSFVLSEDYFSEDSKIYHQYASITHVKIDSPNHRISLSYEINIDTAILTGKKKTAQFLKPLLSLIYKRIIKLDQERKYYNHYNSISAPIKDTQVTLGFQKNEIDINIKPEPLVLNDLVIPGTTSDMEQHIKNRPDLKIGGIIKNVSEEIFRK